LAYDRDFLPRKHSDIIVPAENRGGKNEKFAQNLRKNALKLHTICVQIELKKSAENQPKIARKLCVIMFRGCELATKSFSQF